mmetsp:Transcript_21387/g.59450  ORF Transcript_21387/g.59450 Transcript_21387/m.59450 type:complete len:226 (-) Transcript_21387:461-1138(-)
MTERGPYGLRIGASELGLVQLAHLPHPDGGTGFGFLGEGRVGGDVILNYDIPRDLQDGLQQHDEHARSILALDTMNDDGRTSRLQIHRDPSQGQIEFGSPRLQDGLIQSSQPALIQRLDAHGMQGRAVHQFVPLQPQSLRCRREPVLRDVGHESLRRQDVDLQDGAVVALSIWDCRRGGVHRNDVHAGLHPRARLGIVSFGIRSQIQDQTGVVVDQGVCRLHRRW